MKNTTKTITVFSKSVISKFKLFNSIKYTSDDQTSGTIQPRDSKGHFQKRIGFKIEPQTRKRRF